MAGRQSQAALATTERRSDNSRWRPDGGESLTGLYVHIPFCVRKCAYCDFYSVPVQPDAAESYIDAVLAECKAEWDKTVKRKQLWMVAYIGAAMVMVVVILLTLRG